MATATPLRHPDEAAQNAHLFPHTATFKTSGDAGGYVTLFSSPCAYEARGGGEGADFESEAPTSDQILLPKWQVEVASDQIVVVQFADGTIKRFTTIDALPLGTGPNMTLVLVTPKR